MCFCMRLYGKYISSEKISPIVSLQKMVGFPAQYYYVLLRLICLLRLVDDVLFIEVSLVTIKAGLLSFLGKRVSVSVTITSALGIVSHAEEPASFCPTLEAGPLRPGPLAAPPGPPCWPCSGRDALFFTSKCE